MAISAVSTICYLSSWNNSSGSDTIFIGWHKRIPEGYRRVIRLDRCLSVLMLKSRSFVQIRAAFCRILGCALGAAGIAFSCACPRAAIASESIPSETCPSREAIDAAVTALLGKTLVSSEDMKLVDVMDLGERYVITVKGRTREYSDELRDCAKRARVAAVFVALTLAPPDIASTEAPPQSEFQAAEPPPAPPASPAPAATARARQPSPPQPPEPLASSTVWF